jgi:Uma2 family endonuclease
MAATKTLVTAEDFFAMDFPDVRCELVDGEVQIMSLPGYNHGYFVARILVALTLFVQPRALGRVVSEIGFLLRRDPDLVLGPDVAFISNERYEAQGPTSKFWQGPPDLAVEVLSPDDRPGKVLRKVGDYLDAGTKVVWVVDPKSRSVAAYRSLHDVRVYREDDNLQGEEVIPGFSLLVAEIFK